jgi:hypothetical protein
LNRRLSATWHGSRTKEPGMLKLLRNVIILRALWRLFKRGRRV